MFAKQLLVALTLVSSIVAVQDCCYVELDNLASEGGMVSFPPYIPCTGPSDSRWTTN